MKKSLLEEAFFAGMDRGLYLASLLDHPMVFKGTEPPPWEDWVSIYISEYNEIEEKKND